MSPESEICLSYEEIVLYVGDREVAHDVYRGLRWRCVGQPYRVLTRLASQDLRELLACTAAGLRPERNV